VKEVSLAITRTFYLTPLYLILTYYKLYKYLIICFTIVRCFRLRLIRNCKRIEAEKVISSRIIITVYRIDLISF